MNGPVKFIHIKKHLSIVKTNLPRATKSTSCWSAWNIFQTVENSQRKI